MKYLSCVGLAALALFAGACRSGGAHAPETPPAPPMSSPGITVEERSQSFYGGSRMLPPDAYRPRIDYQSELRIHVDGDEVSKQVPAPQDVLPRLSADQQARLEQLSRLLDTSRTYLQKYAQFSERFEALRTQPSSRSMQQELATLINEQAQPGLELFSSLRDYADAKARAESPGASRGDAIRARDKMIAPILPDGQVIDAQALSTFVAAESKSIVQQASRDARAVQDAGSVYLRMRATLLQPDAAEVPLHIRNYDVLSDTNVEQEPRVSFKMTEADRERLKAESKVNEDLAKLIDDARNRNSDFRKSLNDLLASLRGDAAAWQEAATNLDGFAKKLQTLVDALGKASASAQLKADQKALVETLKASLAKAKSAVDAVRVAIQKVTTANQPGTDPTTVLLNSAESISAAWTAIKGAMNDLPQAIAKALQDVQTLANDLRDAIPRDPANLQALADAAAPSSVDAVKHLLDVALASYPNLVGGLGSLFTKTQTQAADLQLVPIEVDPNLTEVLLTSAPPGYISLARNVKSGGDLVTLDTALITPKNGNAAPFVHPLTHQEFDVEKFGLVSRWSANLIFVYRLGDLSPTEQKVQFAPAPSISWTLHYYPPPDERTGETNRFLDVVDPGVGLDVSALSWDDSGVQVGIGCRVTFFHDLVAAGIGINLNESTHGGYFFVGLGIFETLNQIGITGAGTPVGR